MKDSLFSLYLKYDGQFRTLHKIALAQMLLKILYFQNSARSLKFIRHELESIVKGSVKFKELRTLLNELSNEGKVYQSKKGNYELDSKYRSEVDKLFGEQSKSHNEVINYWFGNSKSDINDVEDWFRHATIQFFSNFSKNWITELCNNGTKKLSKSPNIKVILLNSFDDQNKIIEKDKLWLVDQYIKFLDSTRETDNAILWSYGTSCFASSMITAGRNADKLTVEMFKDSKFILDTNVLLILHLESDELTNSLFTLEKIMSKFKINPGYFYVSREEYIRAIGYVQAQTNSAFSNYSLEVLKESNDPFLISAIKLGCETEEDLDRMFGQMIDLPKVFHKTLSLELFDDSALNNAIEKGSADGKLHEKLNKIHRDRFNEPKRKNALLHDSGMIAGAEHVRKDEKCWIITKDGTVKRYAIENSIRNEEPIAVSLVSLINMMAINSGGSSIDPTNFAPLFARIMRKSLLPDKEVFTLADLSMMVERESQINELPKDDVIEIAKRINKMRFSGEPIEDIDLYMRRALQMKKLEYESDIESAKLNADIERKDKEIAENLAELAITKFREQRKADLIKEKEKTVTYSRVAFIGIVAVIVILTFFFIFNIDNENKYLILIGSVFVEIMGSLLFNKYLFKPKMLAKYSELTTDVDNQVDKEVSAMKKESINS